ncbi:hypothetical protein P3L10_029708 [Capsicum annuum]
MAGEVYGRKNEETGETDAFSTNADASNDKSKSNENVEGENRGFRDEQRTKHRHDTPILEKETYHTVESSPASPSPDTSLVKPIRYSYYSFETLIERYPSLMGSVNVKSRLGDSFFEFRKILEVKNLTKFFKSSIFGKYLNLPNNINIRFQMNLVYQILQHKIISHRKEEVWINYCGMPVCFGIREFAIITGLNYHLPVVYGEEKMST